MKKTVLATAVLMSMGATAAQASMDFNFVGSFAMYQPFQPDFVAEIDGDGYPTGVMLPVPTATSITGPVLVTNADGSDAGGPVTGTMSFDTTTGAGVATMTPSTPFFGSFWSATGITMQMTGPGSVTANMMFNWNGNYNIPVTVDFSMDGMGVVTTLDLDGDGIKGNPMVSGPFAGFNATFSGQAMPVAAVPVPAAAWLLGSGLLGLVGVARRKVSLA